MQPGTIVGPYRIVRSLGRGAMGAVLLGEHLQLSGVRHALKLLPCEFAEEPVLVERFRREMESLAQLGDHPWIVGVHSEGVTREGNLFFAMDYVEGRSLRQALRAGLDREAGIQVLLDVAEALAHAHERGVIHRDVKPDNVLVDADGRGHLADFGLAYVRQAGARLTHSEEVLGTPSYMAPEQIQGEFGPQADVYALGVMLFELVTGQLPFPGQTLIEILSKASTQDPPAPSSVGGAVDPRIDAICQRAITRNLRVRYPTAEAFAADLRALHTGVGSVSARRSPSRLPAYLAAGGVVLVALVAAGWFVLGRLEHKRAYDELAGRVERLSAHPERAGGPALFDQLLAEAQAGGYAPLLEQLRAVEPSVRGAAFGDALEHGDVGAAAEALGAEGTVAHPQVAWVLAAGAGDYPRARRDPGWQELPPDVRATLAAWFGDREECQAALAEAGPAGAALAARLGRYAPGLEPARGEAPAGWSALAEAADELAHGRPLLAELALNDAPEVPGGEPLRLQLRCELAVARGDLRRGAELARELLSGSGSDPVQAGLAAAWLVELQPSLPQVALADVARRFAPRLPPVLAAVARVENRPPEAPGLLGRARVVARKAGRPDLAWGNASAVSFCEAEVALCAAGWDGVAGLLVAQAAQRATAVLRGGGVGREHAQASLQQALVLRPESPALAVAASQLARASRDVEASRQAAERACALAPADPLARLEHAVVTAGIALDPARERRYLALLDEGAPPALEVPTEGFAHALRLAQGAPRLEARVRLAWGNALLCARWRNDPDPDLAMVLEPLLAGLDLEPLRAARRELVAALSSEGELLTAEAAVIAGAKQLHPEQLDALRLLALAGGERALPAVEGVLGSGDALAARMRQALLPRPPDPDPTSPLLPAEVFRLCTRRAPASPAEWDLLGRALAISPDSIALVGLVLAQLDEVGSPPPVAPDASPAAHGSRALALAVAVAARGYPDDELVSTIRALCDARWQLADPTAAEVATGLLVAAGLRKGLPPALGPHALICADTARLGLPGGYTPLALRAIFLGQRAKASDHDALAAAGGVRALETLLRQGSLVANDYGAALEASRLDYAPESPFPTWTQVNQPRPETRGLELAQRLNVVLRANGMRRWAQVMLRGHVPEGRRNLDQYAALATADPEVHSALARLGGDLPDPLRARLVGLSRSGRPDELRRELVRVLARHTPLGERPRFDPYWEGLEWCSERPPGSAAWVPHRWQAEALRLLNGGLELVGACDDPRRRAVSAALGDPLSPLRLALESPERHRGALLLLSMCAADTPTEALLAGQRVVYLGRAWRPVTVLTHVVGPLRAVALLPDLEPEVREQLLRGTLGILRGLMATTEQTPLFLAHRSQLCVDAAGLGLSGRSRAEWLQQARADLQLELRGDQGLLRLGEFELLMRLRRTRIAVALGDLEGAEKEAHGVGVFAEGVQDVSRRKLQVLFAVALGLQQHDPWRAQMEEVPEWRTLQDHMRKIVGQ